MLLLQQVISLSGKSFACEVVLKEMLHLLSELLGLNRGRIVMRDGQGDRIRIRYSYGLTRDEAARGVYAVGEGITGWVLQSGQLTVVQDIDKEERFLCRAVSRARLPQEQVVFIALPVIVGGEVRGVLACHRLRNRARPISDDLTLLRILATWIGQLLHLESYIEEKERELTYYNRLLTHTHQHDALHYGIIGNSPALLRAISELEKVSDSTASVLLLGESGTGKELFARALHLASPRQDKPFIKVNCAAIPDSLFESELFGYEKGAFTGAETRRIGLFEQADEGTLFLDEVGELPLSMQGKLLRALQEGTITRLGGKKEIAINARLVAATNRDLSLDVDRGLFRRDLYYRLNVIPIHLPSLAERKSDIPALVLHFLNRFNQANQRNLSLRADAIAVLQNHVWPGNIRELSNVIERMVLLADKPALGAVDLRAFITPRARTRAAWDYVSRDERTEGPSADYLVLRPYSRSDSHSERELREAIVRSGGNKSRAAQLLGLTARQLNYRLKKLGI
ncbi:GAF domain-containing protein [Affinibrenneria salicis]|uniref:GAF domain-containing protein n=2 Tax=Affinibrenneria salicis TaxID=2590031 RepID=A0A5J5G425_9GAMM|nr:GAF domain-containing protein [Affinibrenneria salicis]